MQREIDEETTTNRTSRVEKEESSLHRLHRRSDRLQQLCHRQKVFLAHGGEVEAELRVVGFDEAIPEGWSDGGEDGRRKGTHLWLSSWAMVWKVEMSGSARSPCATSLSCLREPHSARSVDSSENYRPPTSHSPALIEPEVKIQRPVAVEGDQRSLEVVKDVQRARVEAEDFADWADDLRHEAEECVVVLCDEGRAASIRRVSGRERR